MRISDWSSDVCSSDLYPVAIALMRDRLLMLAGRFEPLMEYPQWGPGRVDTFNAAKVIFNFPIDDLPGHEKNAPSDFPSIWLQQPRQGMQLHWDGNNTRVEERNKSAAFRSEERREGKGCVSTCRSRWSPHHKH